MARKKDIAIDDSAELIALREVIKEINDDLKFTIAGLAIDGMFADIKGFIPTGITMLDLVLRGGLPMGRVVELYGREGTGKSTLAISVIRQCQQLGGLGVLLDSEAKFSKERAVSMGVDLSKLLELNADSLEVGFSTILKTVKKIRDNESLADQPIVIVWDTIAAIPTETEREGDRWAEGMAVRPRIIKEAMRTLCRLLMHKSICLLIVNQVIAQMAKGGHGGGDDTPGGRGIKFHATQRIQLRRTGDLNDTERGLYGIQVLAKVVKNQISGTKIAKTNEVTFPLLFQGGFDDDVAIVDYLLEERVKGLDKKGGWYKFDVDGKVASCYHRQVHQTVEELGIRPWLQERAAETFLQ